MIENSIILLDILNIDICFFITDTREDTTDENGKNFYYNRIYKA